MNLKLIIACLLVCLSSSTSAQQVLKIYINEADVTGQTRWVIHPHDKINFKLEGPVAEQYHFEKVTFEVVLKDGPSSERIDNRKIELRPQKQSDRVTKIKENDIFYLTGIKSFDKAEDPSVFSINTDLLWQARPLSRLIVHVKKVSHIINGSRERASLDNVGTFDKFFSDGISFWAGDGFNQSTF